MGRIGDDAAFPDSGVWNVRDVFKNPLPGVPAVVQSAALWLDAADLSVITQSSGDVSQWNNKGTLGNFTQANAASQPTTGVSTLNGLNVLNFASDFLTSADAPSAYKFLHDATKHLIAAVWQPGTTADPGELYVLYGTAISTADVGATLRYDDRSNLDTINHQVVRGVSGNATSVNNSNNAVTANAFNLLTILADLSNATAADRSEVFIDDSSANKNNVLTNAPSTANPTNALNIGAIGANTLTGKIAEIVIVSGADATEGNRLVIRDYLNRKWGVF